MKKLLILFTLIFAFSFITKAQEPKKALTYKELMSSFTTEKNANDSLFYKTDTATVVVIYANEDNYLKLTRAIKVDFGYKYKNNPAFVYQLGEKFLISKNGKLEEIDKTRIINRLQ